MIFKKDRKLNSALVQKLWHFFFANDAISRILPEMDWA